MSTHNKDKAPRPSHLSRVSKSAGRAVVWPFRNTFIAGPKHIISDQVWSLDEWHQMTRSLTRSGRLAEIQEFDERERFWADPRNWPPIVVDYVRMNMQASALVFLALIGLALMAIIEAGLLVNHLPYWRLCLLCGSLGGLFSASWLYVGVCLDYARFTRVPLDNSTPSLVLLSDAGTLWPFSAPWGLSHFWRQLPGHLRLMARTKPQRSQERRATNQMFARAGAIIAVLLLLAVMAPYMSSLLNF